MKIALYVPSWPSGKNANGIVTYASYIVPALRNLGHDVYVLTFNAHGDESDHYTIDLRRIETKRSFLDRLLLKMIPARGFHDGVGRKIASALSSLHQRETIDVFEIEESFGWSEIISQTQKIPVVVRLHGPWIINGQTQDGINVQFGPRIRKEGRAIASATYVTAASKFALDAVQTYYGHQLARARVIHNPINVDNRCWRLEACDPDSILYVGRFDRAKGADIVLEAFSILARQFPKLRLTFVGPDRGILDDGGTVLQFWDYAAKHLSEECQQRIDFRGELPHAEVMKLRTSNFLGIVASRFEILPYSVIEAMSFGCPVIASQVGGIPELIENGRNGLLFQSGDVQGLVQACSNLLENHSCASELGRQARADCELNLDPERIAREAVSVYEQAVIVGPKT